MMMPHLRPAIQGFVFTPRSVRFIYNSRDSRKPDRNLPGIGLTDSSLRDPISHMLLIHIFLRDILLQLGLKSAGLHAFRHGRVSILLENKVPGDLIKAWVGHSSLRTTSRYTHFGPKFRQEMATEVGLLN
jgi:integrase